MRQFVDSDIFTLMNRNDAITKRISECGKSVSTANIVNKKIASLDMLQKTYRETIVTKIIDAMKAGDIIVVYMPMDKRLPANMPFLKATFGGKVCELVDISKFATVTMDPTDNTKIAEVNISADKLYCILVPAYLDLKFFSPTCALPSESIRILSFLWAKMFNKVLISRKIFVNNQEKYDAFIYFAMRFFMKYYLESPDAIIDSISIGYLGGTKSKYVTEVEGRLELKGVNLYQDWMTFANTMFNNDITGIASFNLKGVAMDEKLYLQLFDGTMGKDGAYMALWSVPYLVYVLFATFNRGYIFNDRAWEDVVIKDRKQMPKLMDSFYKEL